MLSGKRHVLDLHRGDFDAPRIGLAVDDLLQGLIDLVAVREQFVQFGLAEDAAQGGLRDE